LLIVNVIDTGIGIGIVIAEAYYRRIRTSLGGMICSFQFQ